MGDERPLCQCHAVPMRWAKDSRHSRGGYWRCRTKATAASAKYRTENREHLLRLRREYIAANKEKVSQQAKKYREENRDKILAKSRERWRSYDWIRHRKSRLRRQRESVLGRLAELQQQMGDE